MPAIDSNSTPLRTSQIQKMGPPSMPSIESEPLNSNTKVSNTLPLSQKNIWEKWDTHQIRYAEMLIGNGFDVKEVVKMVDEIQKLSPEIFESLQKLTKPLIEITNPKTIRNLYKVTVRAFYSDELIRKNNLDSPDLKENWKGFLLIKKGVDEIDLAFLLKYDGNFNLTKNPHGMVLLPDHRFAFSMPLSYVILNAKDEKGSIDTEIIGFINHSSIYQNIIKELGHTPSEKEFAKLYSKAFSENIKNNPTGSRRLNTSISFLNHLYSNNKNHKGFPELEPNRKNFIEELEPEALIHLISVDKSKAYLFTVICALDVLAANHPKFLEKLSDSAFFKNLPKETKDSFFNQIVMRHGIEFVAKDHPKLALVILDYVYSLQKDNKSEQFLLTMARMTNVFETIYNSPKLSPSEKNRLKETIVTKYAESIGKYKAAFGFVIKKYPLIFTAIYEKIPEIQKSEIPKDWRDKKIITGIISFQEMEDDVESYHFNQTVKAATGRYGYQITSINSYKVVQSEDNPEKLRPGVYRRTQSGYESIGQKIVLTDGKNQLQIVDANGKVILKEEVSRTTIEKKYKKSTLQINILNYESNLEQKSDIYVYRGHTPTDGGKYFSKNNKAALAVIGSCDSADFGLQTAINNTNVVADKNVSKGSVSTPIFFTMLEGIFDKELTTWEDIHQYTEDKRKIQNKGSDTTDRWQHLRGEGITWPDDSEQELLLYASKYEKHWTDSVIVDKSKPLRANPSIISKLTN